MVVGAAAEEEEEEEEEEETVARHQRHHLLTLIDGDCWVAAKGLVEGWARFLKQTKEKGSVIAGDRGENTGSDAEKGDSAVDAADKKGGGGDSKGAIRSVVTVEFPSPLTQRRRRRRRRRRRATKTAGGGGSVEGEGVERAVPQVFEVAFNSSSLPLGLGTTEKQNTADEEKEGGEAAALGGRRSLSETLTAAAQRHFPIDVFCFDGPHDALDQFRALLYFHSSWDPAGVVVVVDDFQVPDVARATEAGLGVLTQGFGWRVLFRSTFTGVTEGPAGR